MFLFSLLLITLVNANNNLQYPGRNQKLKAIIRQEWEKYYNCLENDYKSLGRFNTRKPQVRLVFPGQGTRLSCTPCQRPFENRGELQWRYQSLHAYDTQINYEDLPDEFTLSESQELIIQNAREDFTGLYQCYRKNSSLSAHIIEVPLLVDIIQVNHRNVSESPMEYLEKSFKLNVKWGEWSECSACGKVGQRYQYGVCMVTLNNQDNEQELYLRRQKRQDKDNKPEKTLEEDSQESQKQDGNQTYQQEKEQNQEESEDSNPSQQSEEPKDKFLHLIDILSLFLNGVPCSSKFLPKEVQNMIRAKEAVHMAVVELCKVECPTKTPEQEIDLTQKILEAGGNMELALKKIQEKISSVEREVVNTEIDAFVILQCPGVSNANIPVTWKAVDMDIIPEIIAKQTNGRITVDLFNRITIERAHSLDSNILSCWQRTQLIGTIHFQVEKQEMSGDRYLALLTALTSLMIVLLAVRIATRAIKHRKIK